MTQEEMKKAMEEFGSLMHELRSTVTRREDERAKDQGTSDPITREEIERMNVKLDEIEQRYTKAIEENRAKYTEVYDQIRGLVAAGSRKTEAPESSIATPKSIRLDTPRLVRALAYGIKSNPEDQPLASRVFRHNPDGGPSEKRVGLLDDTGTGGHYMIPDWAPHYIETLSNALVFNGLPVKTIFPKGPVPLNTLATEPTAYVFASGSPITVSNATFTRSTWNPIRIGAACPIDGAVVRRGDDAVTITNEQMQLKVAQLAEYEMLLGDNSTGHMKGLDHLGGSVNSTLINDSTSYGKFTDTNNINKLMDLISAIEQDNGQMEGWIFNSRTKWNMRAIQTAANGDYILTVPNNAGDPPLLLSYPYKVTNQITNTRTVNGKSDCTILFAGKWSDMLIGIWEDVIMSADPSASYVSSATTYSCRQYDQVLYTLIYEVNCLFRHDKNFGYLDGIRDNNAT